MRSVSNLFAFPIQPGKVFLSLVFGGILLSLASQLNGQGTTSDFKSPYQGSPTPWTNLDFNNNPDHFQFAIVTDRTGGHRKGIFGRAVEKLNLLQPEFVMSVGDLIEGYTKNLEQLNAEWKEFDGLIKPLEMPFFHLPGNHDYSNEVMAELWKKKFGRDYYAFTYKQCLFLCLNTNDGDGVDIGAEQRTFIQEQLAANQNVRWTFVFMHHPVWSYERFNDWGAVEKLFTGRKYTVFAGHQHRYLHSVRQDANHYVLATTGGGSRLRGPRFGQFDHITWVTLTEEGPRILNLMLDGMLKHDIHNYAQADQVSQLFKSARYQWQVLSPPDSARNWKSAMGILYLKNHATEPLNYTKRFFHHHQVNLGGNRKSFSIDEQADSFDFYDLRSINDPIPGKGYDPFQVTWTVGYPVGADSLPLELEGNWELPLDNQVGAMRIQAPDIFLEKAEIKLLSPFVDLESNKKQRMAGNTNIASIEPNVHYTLDGSDPSLDAPIYYEDKPIVISKSSTLKAKIINSKGWGSAVLEKRIEKVTPLPAAGKVKKLKPGIRYRYYEGGWVMLPDYATLDVKTEAITPDFDLSKLREREDHYALQFEGWIEVPVTGVYTFSVRSDDGSRLYIDGQKVVDNDGSHSARTRSGQIALAAGLHPIKIDYFEDYGGEWLRFYWEAEGLEREEIPMDKFFYQK